MAAALPIEDPTSMFTARFKALENKIDSKLAQAGEAVKEGKRAVSGFASKASESRTKLSIKSFSKADLGLEESDDEIEIEKASEV